MRVRRVTPVVVPPSPGDVLREQILANRDITQDQLARAMRVSRFSINQIVNGRRAVTAEMALRLSKATSTTPHFWLDLQRGIDLHRARLHLQRELGAVRVVRRPVPRRKLFYTERSGS